MIEGLTLFLNTHSSYSDCWPMFFGQLEKHWPGHPPVFAACDVETELTYEMDFDPPCRIVEYDRSASFGQQYLQGLSYVTTDYVLPMQEDFVIFSDVDAAAIDEAIGCLYPLHSVRLIDSGEMYSYSMQASIWNTTELIKVYAEHRHCKTPWEAEVEICQSRMCERYVFDKARGVGPKRGRDHWDSPILPYCSTALSRGRWNSEYRKELEPLHAEYGIDASQRGWT